MKVILSRKGFDSASGGKASPILPNGKMISLPIPYKEGYYYSDIFYENDKTYLELMQSLGIENVRLSGKSILTAQTFCHTDPDIRYETFPNRANSWRPLFGQISGSQTTLENGDVKAGDLFLFFGTFRKTEINGGLKFCGNPFHAIFGYLQIDNIIRKKEELEDWMKYHPHANWFDKKKNVVYVATEKLSLDSTMRGGGIFEFRNSRILTKLGEKRISTWDLPPQLKGHISWNKEKFQTPARGRGQEFVIKEASEVEEWVKKQFEV